MLIRDDITGLLFANAFVRWFVYSSALGAFHAHRKWSVGPTSHPGFRADYPGFRSLVYVIIVVSLVLRGCCIIGAT